jgi:hypothetical protein
MVKRAIGALLCGFLVIAACSGDDDATDAATTSTTSTTEAEAGAEREGLDGELDISDAVLTNTSPNCADYDVTLTATATDITRALMFDSGVTLLAGDGTCTLTSNNIPNHDFNDESARFATDVGEVARSFEIVRDPQPAAEPSDLSQMFYDGVLLNGVPIDLLSAGCYRPDDPMANAEGIVPIGCNLGDPWLANPLGTEDKFGADEHNAHTQPDGTYHYHGDPNALFDDDPGELGSPVIGFAADGFPIFGSYFLDPETGEVREVVSGYTLKEGERPAGDENPPGEYDGTYYDDYEFTGSAGDLDECNGMEVDGQYGYYVTDAFPYLMFCLSGTPDGSFQKAGPG